MRAAGEGDTDPEAGYRRPPLATRYKKGQSGNPRGRPRNRRREIPYDTVLGQMVTIREDGKERRVTAAEAFLLQLTRKGLQGDSSAARASLQAIETARAKSPAAGSDPTRLRVVLVNFGISTVLATLGMAVKRFPLNKSLVRWELHPWIVETALARMGRRQLDVEEQAKVVAVLRKPSTIRWPDWWSVWP